MVLHVCELIVLEQETGSHPTNALAALLDEELMRSPLPELGLALRLISDS